MRRRQRVTLVGVDTGGTFTDVVARVGREVRRCKVRSTPHDPAVAVLAGLARLAGSAPVVLHYGSTVATNALLERRGARVALVTTAGFEDVIEIGRQTRPRLYDLTPVPPRALVEARHRIGVAERVAADGRVLVPLSAAEVRRVTAAVRRSGAHAVAVCLLHGYARPAHERRLGRALRPLGLHVTLAHELQREHREYERTSTAAVNAYVGPLMARHIGRLAAGTRGRLRVMQSSGGLIASRIAAAEPVRTILSGPAGGVVGAAAAARAAGLPRIVTLDMGGTSTDVAVVDGPLAFRTETTIDGLPVRLPVLDIHTVGAGGGSIARVDAGGALVVGPESAGADPGPACYGRGLAPTVTDANLVLGRLRADDFLGGEMQLDVARARRALDPLARWLGCSVERAAAGMLAVANAAMERAVRVITVERGLDPREFTLLAFGGAGGLHAAELADALGIERVYLPRDPGLLSAWGVLSADAVRDLVATVRLLEPATAVLARRLRPLEREAAAALARDGITRPRIERVLDVRYAGQSYELQVPFGPTWRAA
ncbi:MAG TPA: hydantoinase/oxoprolinase family protein, partial [Candidatus Limnocylindria bacterium]|nr:hydantoinase/oxoprolinase family protein [Candidatus Limnocylindria bacterium]